MRALLRRRKKTGRSISLQLAATLAKLESIQRAFNDAQTGGKRVSLADLIVLAGAAGVEQAAKNAGFTLTLPFARPHGRLAGADRRGLLQAMDRSPTVSATS